MSEFFSMGGFGFYVWISLGTTLLLMLAEPLILRMARSSSLKSIRRFVRLQNG